MRQAGREVPESKPGLRAFAESEQQKVLGARGRRGQANAAPSPRF
jgi:hypothetical protein